MKSLRCSITVVSLALLGAVAAAAQTPAATSTPAAADQQTPAPPAVPATAWSAGGVSVSGLVDYLHNSPKLGPAWKAYGIAGAAKFQVSKKFSISPRVEWLKDPDGADTGVAQSLKEVTMTGTYAIMDRLSMWLEFLNDWSDQQFFNRGNQPGTWKTQPTVLLGMVAVIGPKR
jgi:hypothetical protein